MKMIKSDIDEMLGIEISSRQEEAFQRYSNELLKWNESHNLTAIRTVEDVRVRHFLDSLSCWQVMVSRPHENVIDVGTGAGLPSLALKILQDSLQLTLLESVGKKVRFLEHIVQVLGLEGVRAEKGRAEDFAREGEEGEHYDWAIARAVAPLHVLAEYLLPFVRVGGFMLAQKGPTVETEMYKAAEAIEILGGGKAEVHEVRVPGLDEKRNLVVIEKIRATPEKYPRRAGMPSKRPL